MCCVGRIMMLRTVMQIGPVMSSVCQAMGGLRRA